MSKKRLMLILILLLGSFAVSFGLSAWLGGSPPAPDDAARRAAGKAAGAPGGAPGVDGKPAQLRPDEKLAEGLIKELRSRLEQVKLRERKLEEREQRVRITEVKLKNIAQELESLRVKLVAPLDRLKQAKKDLDDSRVQIQQAEAANLRVAAAIYDKMSAEESGPIFESMVQNRQLDDAVKILRFMSERTAAKMLGQLSEDTARELMDGLKRLQQKG
jgi:flagellar motility protein MotE (MotC chaperone)